MGKQRKEIIRGIKITSKSHSRGHEVYFDGKEWRYSDNNAVDLDQRPCKRCGCHPTKEGYDACLGHIEGMKSVCCGHGVTEPYRVEDEK